MTAPASREDQRRSNLWHRLLHKPQNLLLRRMLFQVHLWTGLAAGVYVLVISLTGSVLVYRNELYRTFSPRPIMVDGSGPPLTADALAQAARDAYPGFAIDAVEVRPFPVPHDAREPVQFVLTDGKRKLGVLTDIGSTTPHVEASLSGCEAIVLECNHDEAMLVGGSYPYPLKQRIGGRYGHLCNDEAASLLRALDTSKLVHVIAAHLSQQNNTPELARAALAGALGCAPEWIGVATQDTGFAWRTIT